MLNRNVGPRVAAVLTGLAAVGFTSNAAEARQQQGPQAGSLVDKHPAAEPVFEVKFTPLVSPKGVQLRAAERLYDATNPQDKEALNKEVMALRRAAGSRSSVDYIEALGDKPHVISAAHAANDAGKILWVDAKGQYVDLNGKLHLPNNALKDPKMNHADKSWNLDGQEVQDLIKRFRAAGFTDIYAKSSELAGGSIMLVATVTEKDGKVRTMYMPADLDLKAFRASLPGAEQKRAFDNKGNIEQGYRKTPMQEMFLAMAQHAVGQPIPVCAAPGTSTPIEDRIREAHKGLKPPTERAPLSDVAITVDQADWKITKVKGQEVFEGEVQIKIDANEARNFRIRTGLLTSSGTFEVLHEDAHAELLDGNGKKLNASTPVHYSDGTQNAEIMVSTLSRNGTDFHDVLLTYKLRGPAPGELIANGGKLVITIQDTRDLSQTGFTKDGPVAAVNPMPVAPQNGTPSSANPAAAPVAPAIPSLAVNATESSHDRYVRIGALPENERAKILQALRATYNDDLEVHDLLKGGLGKPVMKRSPIERAEAERIVADMKAAAGIPEGMEVTLSQQRLIGGVKKLFGPDNPKPGDKINGIPLSEGGNFRINFLDKSDKVVATVEHKFRDEGEPVLWTYDEVKNLK